METAAPPMPTDPSALRLLGRFLSGAPQGLGGIAMLRSTQQRLPDTEQVMHAAAAMRWGPCPSRRNGVTETQTVVTFFWATNVCNFVAVCCRGPTQKPVARTRGRFLGCAGQEGERSWGPNRLQQRVATSIPCPVTVRSGGV